MDKLIEITEKLQTISTVELAVAMAETIVFVMIFIIWINMKRERSK